MVPKVNGDNVACCGVEVFPFLRLKFSDNLIDSVEHIPEGIKECTVFYRVLAVVTHVAQDNSNELLKDY